MSIKILKTKKVESAKLVEYETKVHPGLKIFFGYSLYKAGMIFRSMMEDKHLYKYELGAPDCGILYVLNTGAVVNQLTLGQELGIDKATIVKIIDKLEKAKLVKRDVDPTDRRSKLVSLTAKGSQMVEKVRLARQDVEAEAFKQFSKEDEAHLRRLIPQFLEALMNVKN